MATESRLLAQLLDGLISAPLPAEARSVRITGICDDSRLVRPGCLFVAVRGTRSDGRAYIRDAIARGAVAVIGEDLTTQEGVTTISVADARETLARLAWRWHRLDQPGGCPRLAAVTGTNGKTTVAWLTQAICRKADLGCGLVGTVIYDLGRRRCEANMTTPGPLRLAELLAECRAAGLSAVVLEVSSHALAQRRTSGLTFAAAAFTNLTRDHLDYHGDMDQYRAVKASLFAALPSEATAVINLDDPSGQVMGSAGPARLVTYALDRPADLTARNLRTTLAGSRFDLLGPGFGGELRLPLVGRHNACNALAALGLALALEIEPQAAVAGLQQAPAVPGRLQRVPNAADLDVFIDYAHTPDALENVCAVLRPLARGRLVVVFGCGGERDRGKRPRMAAAVERYADVIVVTSDNPRNEDPERIIAETLAGLTPARRGAALVEPDRRAAIMQAIGRARPGDLVLIAGKGHERYQIVGSERLPFDDLAVALEALADRGGGRCDRPETKPYDVP